MLLSHENYKTRATTLQSKLKLVASFRALAEKSVPRNKATQEYRVRSASYQADLEYALTTLDFEILNAFLRSSPDEHVRDQLDARCDLLLMGIACLNMYVAGLRALEASLKDKTPNRVWRDLSFRSERMAMGVEATLTQFYKKEVSLGLVDLMRQEIKKEIDRTAKLLDEFAKSAKKAGEWWSKTRVPLSFIEGVAIPWYGMIAMGTMQWGQFAAENREDLKLARLRGKVWVGALAQLKKESPKLYDLVLKPAMHNAVKEALRGIGAEDIAFLIGRIIRGCVLSPTGFSIRLLVMVILKTTAIVAVIRAPKFVLKGKAEQAQEVAKAVKEAGIAQSLSPEDVRTIAEELLKPQVQSALKDVSTSSSSFSEPMGRLVQAAKVAGFSATTLPDARKVLTF